MSGSVRCKKSLITTVKSTIAPAALSKYETLTKHYLLVLCISLYIIQNGPEHRETLCVAIYKDRDDYEAVCHHLLTLILLIEIEKVHGINRKVVHDMINSYDIMFPLSQHFTLYG